MAQNKLYLCMLALTLITSIQSANALAQSDNDTAQTVSTPEPLSQEAQQPISANEILRLEETIRGNKEQPQVLTIVPWQLPTHQRINENSAWQPTVESLPSIERNQFLRDLAVVEEISRGASNAANVQGANPATKED
ncbi:hypothetical protein KJ365_11685 [Glaciecola sp. XM2]|uniref:hypothetical protein n=1 Tax=Glaciecola sp. XM2 TaxID=1914931 RepID=UPI001BDF34B7|nr:hypothetical protein [Glaciecola sp. XM2]MBT1451542.1 hypothetical protein [Glaciecola sp. XM2]